MRESQFEENKKTDIEDLMHGSYIPSEEEIEKARKEAEAKGEDADKAEKNLRTKMKAATDRLREKQSRDAIENLEKYIEEEDERGH